MLYYEVHWCKVLTSLCDYWLEIGRRSCWMPHIQSTSSSTKTKRQSYSVLRSTVWWRRIGGEEVWEPNPGQIVLFVWEEKKVHLKISVLVLTWTFKKRIRNKNVYEKFRILFVQVKIFFFRFRFLNPLCFRTGELVVVRVVIISHLCFDAGWEATAAAWGGRSCRVFSNPLCFRTGQLVAVRVVIISHLSFDAWGGRIWKVFRDLVDFCFPVLTEVHYLRTGLYTANKGQITWINSHIQIK